MLGGQGSHVDWSHTDSAGDYSVATGGPIKHLFVVTAPGWAPVSAYVDLEQGPKVPPLVLRDRMSISGTVTGVDGQPACDVSVVVTRRAGGSVDWMRTGPDGRYDLPVPQEGTYVVTAVDRSTSAIITRTVVLGGSAVRTDLQLQAATVTAPVD